MILPLNYIVVVSCVKNQTAGTEQPPGSLASATTNWLKQHSGVRDTERLPSHRQATSSQEMVEYELSNL